VSKPAVLLVDDEPMILESLGLLLGDEFEVFTATSAAAARVTLAQHPVDVVVSDQRMPGESGVSFLAWLRAAYPDTVRILLTGYADSTAMLGAINDAAVWHFANKPWNNTELRNLLRRATESRRRELELAASQARFSALVEGAPVAIVSSDLDGVVDVGNESWRRLAGGGAASMPEALGGDAWARLVAELQLDRVVAHRELSVREAPVLLSAALIHEPALGWRVQVSALDLRPQREAIVTLTRVEGLATLRDVAADVVHDFKNQLTVILSMGALLRDGLPPGPEQECATDIVDAGHMASELAHQLMDLTRGHGAAASSVDVGSIVTRLAHFLGRTLGRRVRVELNVAEGLPVVRVSPSGLYHALLNLAVNARDAMPGGGTLRLEAAEVGGRVCIRVADTGAGIPAELLPRVFDAFFTTKAPGVGTGLGLPMVRRVIEGAGGEVRVTSSVGAGTTFEIHLPAEPTAAPVGRAPGRRIAVLETQRLSQAVAQVLRQEGHEVLEVSEVPTDTTRFDLLVAASELLPSAPDGLLVLRLGPAAGGSPGPNLAKPFGSTELAAAVNRCLGG